MTPFVKIGDFADWKLFERELYQYFDKCDMMLIEVRG
jgi:hypothetical protein